MPQLLEENILSQSCTKTKSLKTNWKASTSSHHGPGSNGASTFLLISETLLPPQETVITLLEWYTDPTKEFSLTYASLTSETLSLNLKKLALKIPKSNFLNCLHWTTWTAAGTSCTWPIMKNSTLPSVISISLTLNKDSSTNSTIELGEYPLNTPDSN